MVGIVIVSHGQMAEGMMDAARMIVGEQENVATVSLKEMDAVERLTERITAAVEDVDDGDGVLVLVDLFGASPFNASAPVFTERENIEVITGVNLPMLLEMAVQRQGQTLAQLVKIGQNAGKTGIRTLSETLGG